MVWSDDYIPRFYVDGIITPCFKPAPALSNLFVKDAHVSLDLDHIESPVC